MLTDVTALKGTAYYEFQPGRYAGQHRRPGSIFFTEQTFAYIEPIFERHRPDFNPYGPTAIARSQWRPILDDLSTTKDLLTSDPMPAEVFKQVGFLSAEDKDAFAKDFDANVSLLRSTIAQLLLWIRQTLEWTDAISILGL
jgi:hypothetical protein